MPEILEAKKDSMQLVPVETNPLLIFQQMTAAGATMEQLSAWMTLQERWEANVARKAFNEAFSAFKAEAVSIVKNTTVKDGPLKDKKYANLFDVVDAITPAESKHGLAHSWKLTKDEPKWMEVTCTIRHALGHSESVSMGAEPDTGPGRNAIQARGSAKSYLERYTLLSITGMAAGDIDDDGNGGPAAVAVSEKDLKRLKDIAEATTFDDVNSLFKEGYRAAEDAKDSKTMKLYIDAKEKRHGELKKALVERWALSAKDLKTVEEFNTHIVPLMKEHGGDFKKWWAAEAKSRGWVGNKATGLYEAAEAK